MTALAELVCSPTVAKRRVVLSLIRRAAGLVMVGLALIAGAASNASAQETITIPVGDFWFCSEQFQGSECLTTVRAGDTVVWDFSGASSTHTTTACTEFCNWDSGNMNGGTFSFTFDSQGGYLYRCSIHPALMIGRIEVEPAPTETLPTQPSPIADGVPAATNTPPPGVPKTGQGPGGGASAGWWLAGALSAVGALLAGAGALSFARRHPQ